MIYIHLMLEFQQKLHFLEFDNLKFCYFATISQDFNILHHAKLFFASHLIKKNYRFKIFF